jgi:hypothetical protein
VPADSNAGRNFESTSDVNFARKSVYERAEQTARFVFCIGRSGASGELCGKALNAEVAKGSRSSLRKVTNLA